MNKQIKIPKGIKIIAGLMLILGLWNIICDIPSGILMGSIDEVLREGSVGEHIVIHKENGSEVTPPLSTKDFLRFVFLPYIDDLFVMTDAIIIGPLLITASIGLWRIKAWGLLVTMIALGAKFCRDALGLLFYYTGYVKTDLAIEADGGSWCGLVFYFCLLILSIVSIVYLTLNKSEFGFTNKTPNESLKLTVRPDGLTAA